MAELEKVKKGFERCLSGKMPFGCGECPYFGDEEYTDAWSCRLSLMRDSFDLLKEQEDLGTELANAVELIHKKNERIEKLLKEYEAVEPTFKQDKDGIYVWACGSCGAYMYHIYDGIDKAKEYAKYCRQCGRKVKWE